MIISNNDYFVFSNRIMKRRKLIKLSAFIVSGSAVGMMTTGCKSDTISIDLDGYSPSYLSADQYRFIKNFADTLLPETDTPGATTVGVPQIYDTILNNILTDERKKADSAQLQDLMESIHVKNNSKTIADLTDEERHSFITSIDQTYANSSETTHAKTYNTVKNRIIQYYLNTEEVGTKLLNYLPVPGEYKACISLEEAGGKAWTI